MICVEWKYIWEWGCVELCVGMGLCGIRCGNWVVCGIGMRNGGMGMRLCGMEV